MARTQQDIAFQMIRQLRVLDPSVSADLGTPERKIIDTVAQAIADTQVDLTVLASGFDLDSKLGEDLDRFLAIFGFARQVGSNSTGVVEFGRSTPSNSDIPIPAGTQIASPGTGSAQALFATTSAAVLPAGETSVFVPIRSANVGAYNNVAANTITLFVGAPLIGITSVTNPNPTVGGRDPETDAELKVRFRNTLFRNVAGTEDQYLALAVAGSFTNKAVVIGPISRYREYVQVPQVDDSATYDVNGDGNPESGNGNGGEYTTALSTIPYSEYTYSEVPAFVSNGKTGIGVSFFAEGVDYTFNTGPGQKNRGDAYRLARTGADSDPLEADHRPNVTFLNVYTGASESVEAVRPGDILLLEHSYVSSASRNDFERNITNCVDVYLNGTNSTQAVTVVPRPDPLINQFIDDPVHRFYFENYRRLGEPEHRPQLGNVFTPLLWVPLVDLPNEIVVGSTTYKKGSHYWGVEDVSELRGTVRARCGVEWSVDAPGIGPNDGVSGPWTGLPIIQASEPDIAITYFFDKSIIDLQAALEANKQVTTDVLAHQAKTRYFKIDVTIMYTPGSNASAVNNSIRTVLQSWFENLYFGSTIQLSDILQVIHNVSGVDNVRWSTEVNPSLNRIIETDAKGRPLIGIAVDRVDTGTTGNVEVQQFYLTGAPTGGSYRIKHGANETEDIAYNASLAEVNSKVANAGISATVTEGDGTPASPFQIRFDATGHQNYIEGISKLTGGDHSFDADFFLKDSELPSLAGAAQPGDTVAGLIIRPRAQSTWQRS